MASRPTTKTRRRRRQAVCQAARRCAGQNGAAESSGQAGPQVQRIGSCRAGWRQRHRQSPGGRRQERGSGSSRGDTAARNRLPESCRDRPGKVAGVPARRSAPSGQVDRRASRRLPARQHRAGTGAKPDGGENRRCLRSQAPSLKASRTEDPARRLRGRFSDRRSRPPRSQGSIRLRTLGTRCPAAGSRPGRPPSAAVDETRRRSAASCRTGRTCC